MIHLLDDESCRRIAQYVYELLQKGKVDVESTDEILDINRAADFLKTTSQAVRMKCRRGKLPYHKKGSRYVFSKNEIKNFLIK